LLLVLSAGVISLALGLLYLSSSIFFKSLRQAHLFDELPNSSSSINQAMVRYINDDSKSDACVSDVRAGASSIFDIASKELPDSTQAAATVYWQSDEWPG
jgi:hypothetical protein